MILVWLGTYADLRDAHELDDAPSGYVYVVHARDVSIYVGFAKRARRRVLTHFHHPSGIDMARVMHDHQRESESWRIAVYATDDPCDEYRMIRCLRPLLNQLGHPGQRVYPERFKPTLFGPDPALWPLEDWRTRYEEAA